MSFICVCNVVGCDSQYCDARRRAQWSSFTTGTARAGTKNSAGRSLPEHRTIIQSVSCEMSQSTSSSYSFIQKTILLMKIKSIMRNFTFTQFGRVRSALITTLCGNTTTAHVSHSVLTSLTVDAHTISTNIWNWLSLQDTCGISILTLYTHCKYTYLNHRFKSNTVFHNLIYSHTSLIIII